jgi:ABC-type lipoprotein release transport system permease subunit
MILRLAWRNLWRHSRRSWLTIAAIAFATLLLIFMITLQLGSYDMMINNNLQVFTGHFQVQAPGYLKKPQMRNTLTQPQQLAAQIRPINGIVDIAIRAKGFALIASEQRTYGAEVVGVETAHEKKLSNIPKLIKTGRFLSDDNAQELIIGEVLARNLKVTVGDELTLLGSGRDGSIAAAVLPIVGIFKSGEPGLDRNLIEIPLNSFQEIFTMQNQAHIIVGIVENLDDLETILTQIRTKLTDKQVVLDWDTLVPGLMQLIEADFISSWFLYICLVFIVTFSILNTFLMAVLERTREFGVMLALGAKPFLIAKLVILESLLLTLLGLAIGMIIGITIVLYFYIHGFSYPGMEELGAEFGITGKVTPELSLLAISLGPLVILTFTMLASIYPALGIRLLKPVDAMKSV